MPALTRIDLRVDEEKKNVIARAAELAGLTITQYVLGLVWPDAERRVAESSRVRLSEKNWEAFTARLDEAPRDLSALKALLARESRFQDVRSIMDI